MKKGICLVFGAALALAACGSEPEAGSTSAPEYRDPEVPRVESLRWVGCGITRKAFMSELAEAFTEETGIEIDLEGGGATRGIRETAAHEADMGGSCRHTVPVEAEVNARLIPVGWDALAVVAHPDNPVDDISLEQLRGVLTGDITRWSELGGPDEPIHLLVRRGTLSGVGRMTRELVFREAERGYAGHAQIFASSGPLEVAAETDPLALGVTGISSARHRDLKRMRLDGIPPDYDEIASGRYRLFRPLYLVAPREEESANEERRLAAHAFIRFALGERGQGIIQEAGTVNLEDGSELWPIYRRNMMEAGVEMGLY